MRYGVLGPVEAMVDGTAIAIGGPQQRRILAVMLARTGQPISVEHLLECLWPDGLAPNGASFGFVHGSDDAPIAVASGNDRSITVFDLASGEQLGDTIVSPDDEVVAFALRPDGKEMAFGGGAGEQFTVWDLEPSHWTTAACTLAGRNLTRQEWATNIGDLAPYHRTCPEYA